MIERRGAGVAAALSAVLACAVCGSCGPKPAAPPLLRLEARDFTLTTRSHVAAGLTRVRLVNEGGFWHHAIVVRLTPPLTVQGYLDSVRAGVQMPTGGLDVGGPPLVVPGDSLEVLMELEPGPYLAVCFGTGGGVLHSRMGMATGFDVAPRDRAARSLADTSADLVLGMTATGFDFPAELTPGTRRVRIENADREFHEVDIVRLDAGRTASDYRSWNTARQTGPAPGRTVGGTSDFGPGVRAWQTVSFSSGSYVLMCDMHADSGQVATFVVRDSTITK